MKVVVVGCVHGRLDEIYDEIRKREIQENVKVF
jgi:hypothetical protein